MFLPRTRAAIKNNILTHPKTTAALLGLLSVLVLPPYYIWPLLFITMSGMVLLLSRTPTFKKTFTQGYWFGFTFYGAGFSWICNALLIEADKLGWLILPALIAGGAFFGLFTAIAATFTCLYKSPQGKVLSFSAAWTLLEWIRSFILTGFPWNLLGTSLAFSDKLIQGASLFGTYGLSLLVALSTSAPAIFLLCKTRRAFWQSLLLSLLPILFLYGYGFIRLHNADFREDTIRIRIVQPSIPQSLKWNKSTLENNFKEYLRLSQTQGIENISIIVWGETASPYPLEYAHEYRNQIARILPPQTLLMTGAMSYKLHRGRLSPQNAMLTIDRKGEIVATYAKSHLVPFGEYIPLREFLPQAIKPITNVISDFVQGQGPQSIELPNGLKIGTAICYEIIFPHQIIDADNKPEVVFNLTNDGWYGDSSGPRQHLVNTQMRAVEEGVSIIRAANSGISALISPYGTIIQKLDLNNKGVIDVNLPKTKSIATLYTQYGNLIPLLMIVLIFIIGKQEDSYNKD